MHEFLLFSIGKDTKMNTDMHAKEHLEIMANVGARVRGIDAKRLRLAQLQVGFAFSAFILIGANDGALGVLIPSMRLHSTIALISNNVSSRILPSAIGFMVSLGSVGAAICPWLAGMLAEHVGLLSLMPSVIILTAVMVCFWQALQIRPRVPRMPLEEPG
jgi:fucose permease